LYAQSKKEKNMNHTRFKFGKEMFMSILVLTVCIFGLHLVKAQPEQSGYNNQQNKIFEFPTSDDGASFHFTSVPDLFNWNIKYPHAGWEDAMDWFLEGMKKEGPAFMLNAGDIMDARWWSSKEQVVWKTWNYWGGFKRRFKDKDIKLYIAPGDHEYGDDQGLSKMHLTPVYAEQFANIFDHPKNGPEHMKELAYSFTKGNLAVITVNTFEDAGDHMSMTVSGKQLKWLEEQLQKYQDKQFIIVQGHVPVFGPVASKNSSANMLEGGADTEFWKTMVEYGVDAYLCGEHHRITAKQRDGIWQIVHGALWGTQTDVNYMRGSVFDDQLKFELFRFPVEYSGGYVNEEHPHRGPTNRPHQIVSIPETVKQNGPTSVGQLIIEADENGNQTVKATGEFKNE
jgi:3',5'-cyclic AMP phosphodiesterase CpdA